MEILEGEKERYQFEHEKSVLDLKRALEHEKEINRIRLASLSNVWIKSHAAFNRSSKKKRI